MFGGCRHFQAVSPIGGKGERVARAAGTTAGAPERKNGVTPLTEKCSERGGRKRARANFNETKIRKARTMTFQLLHRYPARRRAEDGQIEQVYVLRSHLTIEERQKNIARLRREAAAKSGQEAAAKSAHADALEKETELLIRAGS